MNLKLVQSTLHRNSSYNVDWNNAMNRTYFDFLSSIFKKKDIRNQGDLLRGIDNKTIIYVYLL